MKQNEKEKILKSASDARVFELIDTEAALAKTKEELGLDSRSSTRILPLRSILRIAASIVITASVGFAIYLNQTSVNWTTVTATNSIKEYKLPDGSIVTLNKNSSLSFASNIEDERLIRLDGEAFFDVARDESRPFIITAGKAEVQVLGTSFNVQSKDKLTAVSVQSGKVSLTNLEQTSEFVILTKGDAAALENGILENRTMDPNFLSWKSGVYTFSKTPMKEALMLLAKRHSINLDISELGDLCTITSTFDQPTWKEIIAEFELLYGLKFESAENGPVIVKGGNSCE